MIKMTQEFTDFLASPLESRLPTFVNNCLTERGRKIANQLGPVFLEILKNNYHIPPAAEVAKYAAGDCFHSSVAVFFQLFQSYPHPKIFLVTGTFRPPSIKEVIYHAWLQCDNVVFNVSMIPLRPLYSVEFEHYKKHNSLTRIIQKIGIREFNELAKKLDMRSLKDGDAISSDVVVNTLLSKTLREQRRYLDGLRK